MDILKNNKLEELRISVPDGDDAEVKVLGIDKVLNQAVLMVHEPAKEFQETIWDSGLMKYRTINRRTREEKRRFLVGMDECHLFIAQLTGGATSVQQAHDNLRPRNVPSGKAAKKRKIKRQGEFFFVPASPSELRQIEDHAASFGIIEAVGIGGRSRRFMRGRPHVVDQSVTVALRRWEDRAGQHTVDAEFVRGKVRHPDHQVINLDVWHRVWVNTEDRETLNRVTSWVD